VKGISGERKRKGGGSARDRARLTATRRGKDLRILSPLVAAMHTKTGCVNRSYFHCTEIYSNALKIRCFYYDALRQITCLTGGDLLI
jgi:hypothetical protein